MRPEDFRRTRTTLRLSQDQLAQRLRTSRRSIIRYEDGSRKIPGMAELVLQSLSSLVVPLAGTVAAGEPIEPIPQTELVEVPRSMVGRGEVFALRVKGTSMQGDGILSGDIVVVQKQATARNGQTVIAVLNDDATIKTYQRSNGVVTLLPANEAMRPIVVHDRDSFRIEGVVVGVIRHLSR